MDLRNAFKDKNKAFQDLQKQYIELKEEKMRFQARDAASEVAEQVSQNAVRGRFPSKSHAVYSRGVGGVSGEFQGARGLYTRPYSGSSESADGLRAQRAGTSQAWQQTKQPSRGYTSRQSGWSYPMIEVDRDREHADVCDPLYTSHPFADGRDTTPKLFRCRRHHRCLTTATQHYRPEQCWSSADEWVRHERWNEDG